MSLTANAARVLSSQLAAESERASLEVDELSRFLDILGEADPDSTQIWAIAGHLQAYYSGIEAMLLRILKEVDGVVPSGPDSHQEILRQAAVAVARLRPSVLDAATVESLSPYLAFRRFFRHAYGVTLRWDRMRDKVQRAREVFVLFDRRIAALRTFLAELADAGD